MYLDPASFSYIPTIESCAEKIRMECLALPSDAFDPWVQRAMYNSGWDVYGLLAWGHLLPSSLSKCPATAAMLERIPGVQTAGFSRLRAGAHITPHRGWVTNVYRVHLGLVIPENCAMTVAGETKTWEEGRCLIFDDTSVHEAWNRSQSDRVVLLLDVLRPGCQPQSDADMPDEVQQQLAEKLRSQG
jgi:aspartyl/asparaginyl beta-hydroxylase (cupin superfamily)